MGKISDGAARAAAVWWSNNVGPGAKCDAGVGQSRSVDDLMNKLRLNAIIDMSRKDADSPEQQALTRFEEEIYQYLITYDGHGTVHLDVDYHPATALSDAADNAGLKLGMTDWPWKTTMWVDADRVVFTRLCCPS